MITEIKYTSKKGSILVITYKVNKLRGKDAWKKLIQGRKGSS